MDNTPTSTLGSPERGAVNHDDADDHHGDEAVEGTHQAWYDLGRLGPMGERAATRLDSARRDVTEFAHNHPIAAVGAAATLGFLVARIFRR